MPSVGVMTDKFESAAALMARVLGAEDHRFIVVEHPISSAGDEELGRRARVAAAEAASILTGV